MYNTTNCPTYQELLNRANMSTLNNCRRLQDIAVMMYKVKINLSPEYISELFSKSNNHYDLRNADFNTPRYNTVKNGKHSHRYYVYIWSKVYIYPIYGQNLINKIGKNPVYSHLGEILGKLTLKVY